MYMIFGGQTFYANGGANDFICMVKKSIAQVVAYELIGEYMEYKEDWDETGDYKIKIPIEWTQVTNTHGKILHSFGKPFMCGLHNREIKFLERYKWQTKQ